MTVLDMLKAPWAIEPEILIEMCAIYGRHRNGETVDIKAIEAATGRTMSNTPKNYEVQDGVALIPIEGILSKRMGLFEQMCGGMSYTSLQQDLAQALADPNVRSIILTIDSPGGTVDGCEAAGNAIYDARSQKPVVAYVDGKACSAAYWLGSAASQMYIGSDADVVGSIGVIMTHIDTSNAEHQRGVKYTEISAGRYKTTGSQHAPLSSQDRNTLQDMVDQLCGSFVETVARNRGVAPRTVSDKMADGRVFLGQKAIEAGLVDGKTTLAALIAKLGSGQKLAPPTVSRRAGQPSQLRSDTSTPPPAVTSSTQVTACEPVLKQPQLPPTEAELKISKLIPLKMEEVSTRRLLEDAIKAGGTAQKAIAQAQRTRAKAEELLPYTTALARSQETQRVLKSRLRANDQEQLAVLRGRTVRGEGADAANAKPETIDPVAVAEQARTLVAKAKTEGRSLSFAQAVHQLTAD